ncbi:MAG TPA: Glu/Leu/Phe/Val dehydrogenase dimerization domain-containing protein [Candidatus Saccharimonadales bacterium]|nr:Glu/Leu/Phe/Val dehydrogenase dimerization domain-containing protein [Candidatus Saccharimonadales bacterium]
MKKTLTPENLRQIYAEADHEKVVLWSVPSANYRGVIAIHSTALGPAVGGTRIWNYPSDEAATLDALRLSRAMSYKTALAGVPFGGGKAVIIGDSMTLDRESVLRAHGRFVDSFGGRFITAQDVGTSPEDMEYIRLETSHVVGLTSGIGDPSPTTAYGVFRALQASAKHRWGSIELTKKAIAIQGCGRTGYELARRLHHAGGKILVSDTDAARVKRVVDDFGAIAVAPDQILSVKADILAPCALGGVINDETISRLSVEMVVGSANNQLLEDRHGDKLHELGILYVPDFVANAGGVVHGCRELLGWPEVKTKQGVDQIYETVIDILKSAGSATAPFRVANRLAERKLALNKS